MVLIHTEHIPRAATGTGNFPSVVRTALTVVSENLITCLLLHEITVTN